MYAVALITLAIVLAWVAPRVMARLTLFRRAPALALLVWQSVSTAAVLSALFAAPALVPAVVSRFDGSGGPRSAPWWLIALVAVVSGLVLARLLVEGHRVGTRLRALRAHHRDLVDVLAAQSNDDTRVLAHTSATAYCVPGRARRVVLTQGALDVLAADELEAVLTHEAAHLRHRHDLLIEFFTVLHQSVPAPLRSGAAMREVRLLAEALADRVAATRVGEVPTARALVALASGSVPDAAMGAGGPGAATTRLRLLAQAPLPRAIVTGMGAYAVLVLSLPVALIVMAWT